MPAGDPLVVDGDNFVTGLQPRALGSAIRHNFPYNGLQRGTVSDEPEHPQKIAVEIGCRQAGKVKPA